MIFRRLGTTISALNSATKGLILVSLLAIRRPAWVKWCKDAWLPAFLIVLGFFFYPAALFFAFLFFFLFFSSFFFLLLLLFFFSFLFVWWLILIIMLDGKMAWRDHLNLKQPKRVKRMKIFLQVSWLKNRKSPVLPEKYDIIWET